LSRSAPYYNGNYGGTGFGYLRGDYYDGNRGYVMNNYQRRYNGYTPELDRWRVGSVGRETSRPPTPKKPVSF
jgi:hypothetical protein